MNYGRRDNTPIRSGDEQDAYTVWRHLLCYTSRAGVIKAVKRRTHKWARRQARAEIDRDIKEMADD